MNKWIKIGSVVTVVAIISMVGLGIMVFAQKPDTSDGIGFGWFGGRGGNHGGMMDGSARQEKLAETLGITTEELQTALAGGQTIEEIAAEKGVTLPARPEGFGGRGVPNLDKLAETLGMTVADLQAALDGGQTIEEIAAEKGVTLPARPEGFGGRGGELMGEMKDVVAELLGMTTAELETARQNGQTIAELLTAKGLTEKDLAKAVYDAALEKLTTAVTDGKLTQTQADNQGKAD